MGNVYLIHFDQKLSGRAQHYVGYTRRNVEERLDEHAHTTWNPNDGVHGPGAVIMGAVNANGIAWQLAQVYKRVTRKFERGLKNCKNASRYCPICNPDAKPYHPRKRR